MLWVLFFCLRCIIIGGGLDDGDYAAEDRQHNMVVGKQGLVWCVKQVVSVFILLVHFLFLCASPMSLVSHLPAYVPATSPKNCDCNF